MAIDLNKNDNEPLEEQGFICSTTEEGATEKKRLFTNPFSFSGRIRRLEFGLSCIIYFFCAVFIAASVEESSFWGLMYIPLIWFWWAQLCKRFHDRNRSGAHILTLFIPIYNFVVIVMLLFDDGDPYENDYGPDPKGRNMFE